MLGQTMANIGDVLYMVSIISVIFLLTESATAASFVPFTITTAMFISSLLTPLLIGKVNLKWLIAGSQISKTVILIMLGLLLFGLTEANYYFIFLLIGVIAFLDGCAHPIMQTLIPHYVPADRLLRANGIIESVTQIIQAMMWFVGSMFLLIMSQQQLIWVVAILFAISSVLLCLLDQVYHKSSPTKKQFEQVKAGWKTLVNTPVLKTIASMEIIETIASTVWIAAILYVFVSDALQVGESWWGYINGAFFIGLILGSLYCVKYASFIEKKLGSFIFIGSLVSCLITVLFSVNSMPSIALILSLGIGLFTQIKSVPLQTIIQTSVEKHRLATVYTSLGALGTGIFGIGSLLIGVLADLFGVRIVFIISACLLAIASIIVYQRKHLFIKRVTD